ncbi:MAG TPA: AAA family ATPase [Longimicrobiales bacterium]|nr:AAA family ATPase [Longimicrobiales bacterium]
MKLESARVRLFRNIVDSGEVAIEGDVTCLVGKNESGKTAFLHALQRLNPARGGAKFSVPDQYPAWLEKRDRLRGGKLEEVSPVSASFSLRPAELKTLEARFGKGCISSPSQIVVSRTYGGHLNVQLGVSEEAYIGHAIAKADWPRGTKTGANKVKSVEGLREYLDTLKAVAGEDAERGAVADAILKTLSSDLGSGTLAQAVWAAAEEYLPKFLYFSEYSRLPYSVDINRVLTVAPEKLDEPELTARSLLRLAAAEDAYLKNPDYERRKRELENVANAITADVLKYWTQNPDLRVQPDITQRTVSDQQGHHAVLHELKIRIWDHRHLLSLPFSEHSTGFQWFFSFLAAFSEYEFRDDSLVILLDEPALGLHARAQADFLRFIDERLTPKRQVLYTTHSPFMVQPGALERVRLVEDKGQELGSVVSADVSSSDPDTLFPLQGALGYDLVQHLFIAPHNLVVEGTSDFAYLTTLSAYLRDNGRAGLDERWSIVPVGGVDLVPTFVALLGNHLDLTVLVDGKKGGHQRLNRMVDAGILASKRILTIGEVLQAKEGDVEDLFAESDYLAFLNPAFALALTSADVRGTDPIVRRVARAMGVDRYDHGKPADYFLRNRDQILPALAPETLDRFESLFEKVNATLPS